MKQEVIPIHESGGDMEESLDELYRQFVECRKKKIKELIEVQSSMSVAEEVSHVKRAQIALEQLLSETDSSVSASKLSSEIRANANFMMDVMGLGKEQIIAQNQTVLPESNTAIANNTALANNIISQIGVIESVGFED